MGTTLTPEEQQNAQETINIERLNEDIARFPQVHPITADMHRALDGVSRLVMLDRYAFKDIEKITLKQGDFVVLTVKEDPKFPARGYGFIIGFDRQTNKARVRVDPSFRGVLEDEEQLSTGVIDVSLDVIEKPLEIYYEQIAKRVATGLAAVETTETARKKAYEDFYHELVNMHFVPAGRVLYGAGAETDVTYFNCYVMPYPRDSRGGIAEHRKKVMEIMSRGGGVGTNGSTLRPRGALCKGVNGKSSGSVSWLDDIAKLTHLVEQGGSRRGAQMIMLSSWHPDIIEFIISKMQNPRVLRFIIEKAEDPKIKRLAQEKLKFTPLKPSEAEMYEGILKMDKEYEDTPFTPEIVREAEQILADGGTYTVHHPDFLTGANISVCLTRDLMEAVAKDAEYELKFPDIEHYNAEQMRIYNTEWAECGDVRAWEARGYGTRVYQKIRAKELWKLINICATYSAEPGIFFIDNANEMTNATAYGQQVVATNPCFHPDTRVATEFGLLRIEDLYKKVGLANFLTATDDRLVHQMKVVNGRSYEVPGVTMRTATVFPTGHKKTVHVHLTNGMNLQVTPDHRLLTAKGWEEAQHLSEGDAVYVQSGAGLFAQADEIGEAMGHFLGWVTGDGWLTKDGRVGMVIGEEDSEVIPKMVGIGHSLCGLKAEVHEREDGTFQVLWNRKALTERLIGLGVRAVKAKDKRVPESIFGASRQTVEAYLQALFSAAGTVYTADEHHRTVVLTSASKRLLQEVQLLLLNFGIHGKIDERPKKNQARFTYVSANGEEKVYSGHPFYELILTDNNLNEFKEQIGFELVSRKQEALVDIARPSRENEKFYSKVAQITEGETVTVYDITEPVTHSLIANGIVAHNCGEQPLAPYSVCNLAAVNLAEMVDKEKKQFDFEKLKKTVRAGVRMQDNVIDATPYFLAENTEQAKGERRVGLGVMGLHDALIYEEKVYGSEEGNQLVDRIFETIATTAYEASVELAKEKGSFPFLTSDDKNEELRLRERFTQTGYMCNMQDHVREGVLKHGIRNSHLLTVAPTGSTGTMVGVSTGLEPYFSFTYYRSGRLGKFIEVKADIVQQYLNRHPDADPDHLPAWFISAMELTPEQHADVQCIIQRWVDSSLSKTVNAPKGYTVNQVQAVYERLHRGGAKGGTVYVDGSRDAQVLSLTPEDHQFESSDSLFEDWEVEEQPKQYVLDTIPDLKSTDVTYGTEVGETCPICRKGTVEDIGGCNTCSNCSAQLKCGL